MNDMMYPLQWLEFRTSQKNQKRKSLHREHDDGDGGGGDANGDDDDDDDNNSNNNTWSDSP